MLSFFSMMVLLQFYQKTNFPLSPQSASFPVQTVQLSMIMPNGIAIENQLYGGSVLAYLKNKCWMYSETQQICSFLNYAFREEGR